MKRRNLRVVFSVMLGITIFSFVTFSPHLTTHCGNSNFKQHISRPVVDFTWQHISRPVVNITWLSTLLVSSVVHKNKVVFGNVTLLIEEAALVSMTSL